MVILLSKSFSDILHHQCNSTEKLLLKKNKHILFCFYLNFVYNFVASLTIPKGKTVFYSIQNKNLLK